MSFSGKQYKRVKAENVEELMDKLGGNEAFSWFRNMNTLTTYCMNDDGTFQFTVKQRGEDKPVMDKKIELNKEVEVVSPDGVKMKIQWTIEGNIVKNTLKLADGKTVTLTKFFENDGKMKMEILVSVSGESTKGYIYYEAV